MTRRSTVIVVGGPAGTGKSTQGELFAKNLNCPLIEGDDLHPKENVDKMARGQPLTDEDRWGWLKELSEVASTKALDENNESGLCVVTCSMLKKIYREFIKANAIQASELNFRFVFLYTTFEELVKRVESRKGHYMKSEMVKSQYDIMEIPKDEELGEAIPIDTTNKTPAEIFEEIITKVKFT
ncbi:SUV3 [[Candida] subhashii]|uniref:Gluconokinase n=1 Tax=[Candida] subhashii TaxID=561895 RepID=A0A8J5UH01_9ASCO|nr:SUV3 [[Candida] subhashii]KAG7660557.1 SUV3 [[Candida] subhashii]